jgi:hypothetical protein
LQVRAHPWIDYVRAETSRSLRYGLRNGLALLRSKGGDPARRYVVLDPQARDAAGRIGTCRTFNAALQMALRYRMYAQPLVVPRAAPPLSTKMATVSAGTNAAQTYWQSRDGQVCLIRNHGESRWWAMEKGSLVEDTEELTRMKALYPNLAAVVLSAPTAEALAARLASRGLQIHFDPSQSSSQRQARSP